MGIERLINKPVFKEEIPSTLPDEQQSTTDLENAVSTVDNTLLTKTLLESVKSMLNEYTELSTIFEQYTQPVAVDPTVYGVSELTSSVVSDVLSSGAAHSRLYSTVWMDHHYRNTDRFESLVWLLIQDSLFDLRSIADAIELYTDGSGTANIPAELQDVFKSCIKDNEDFLFDLKEAWSTANKKLEECFAKKLISLIFTGSTDEIRIYDKSNQLYEAKRLLTNLRRILKLSIVFKSRDAAALTEVLFSNLNQRAAQMVMFEVLRLYSNLELEFTSNILDSINGLEELDREYTCSAFDEMINSVLTDIWKIRSTYVERMEGYLRDRLKKSKTKNKTLGIIEYRVKVGKQIELIDKALELLEKLTDQNELEKQLLIWLKSSKTKSNQQTTTGTDQTGTR